MDNKPAVEIAELVDRHHAEVYGYAYRLCGAVADAEDLSQQVFLIAHQKLHQLRSADAARAWLFAILRNCFWRGLQKSRATAAIDVELDLNGHPDGASLEDLDAPLDQERLQQALDSLPPEFRIVITMFYFEELSYREIAAALNLPEGTVMSRLSRAKGRLRKRMSEQERLAPDSQRHLPR